MRPFVNRRLRLTALGLGALAVVALGTTVIRSRQSAGMTTSSAPLVAFDSTSSSEAEVRDRDIAFYTRRASEDRQSATDRLTLATLLITRARTTGSTSDLVRAESLSRESIALRSQRNGQAHAVLATVLMSRHAFREAHAEALRADSLEPETPSHLALLGEIELELGEYDAASAHFKSVHYDGRHLTVAARVARWYEITGHADLAREILTRAIVHVDRRDDLPREQVAWFHYRLGELELRLGRVSQADTAFRRGLARHVDDVRILGGLARVALARGDYRRAVEYGDRATGVQLDPATLGTVSEAYAALRDSTQAAQYANAMSISALTQPGTIHRAWGLFLLDHGSAVERADVLRRARRDILERQDIYAHDLLAWALFRSGQVSEAREQMRLALSQHTEDQLLASHARAMQLRTAVASK